MRFSGLDTALTILCTFACVLGLSYAPGVPESLKPIPALSKEPAADVFISLLFRSTRTPVGGAPLEGGDEAAVPEAEPPEPEDEPETTPDSSASRPTRSGFAGEIEPRASRDLEALRVSVAASHVDIIDVCRDPLGGEGQACKRFALDGFFDALDAIERGERKQPVRIVHFGDSLIASDYISDVLRRRLQKRFGNGGRGYLFIDRPSRLGGLRTRCGEASTGFEMAKIPEPLSGDGVYGFSGVSFTAKGNEHVRFDAKGATRASVYFQAQPGAADIEAHGDGRLLARIPGAGERRTVAVDVALPPGTSRFELKVRPGARLFGVALDRDAPGVTLESIGLLGAYSGAYLKAERASFEAALARRSPDLNIIMLGGNEALRLDNGWTNLDVIRQEARELIDRVQAATPAASCLVVSPFASGVTTMGSEIRVRKETRPVGRALRDVAAEAGCAFWDVLEAQGGENAIVRFSEARLMNADLVHPVRKGADLLGHLFETALQRAYFVHHGPDALADPAGLYDPSGQSLERFFGKLMRLEKEKKGRVAIVQLGASHTAGHMFTDTAREALQERYGDAGRGYIAAGAPSLRLKRSKVTRQLSKGWRIHDAMRAGEGEPWSLTGIRAVGKPQASMEITFCEGCQPSKTPAVLEVHYLEQPGMGRIEVRLDNKVVGLLPEAKKGASPTVVAARTFRVQTRGDAHSVRLKNVGENEITVLGVSEELESPGIVYDALGLPGATAVVADGFDKPTFEAQLAGRAADLYVLFYGTNESALPRFDATEYKRRYVSLLDSLTRASPEADCLILGPTDRMAQTEDGSWQEVGALRGVIAALRQVAETRGCAFWSARAAMGGGESIQRWLDKDPPLAHWDHVHLSEEGYGELARLWLRELLEAREAYALQAPSAASLTQLDDPEPENKKKRKR